MRQSFLRSPSLLSLSLPALISTMTTSASSTTPPVYPSYRYAPRHSSFPYTSRDFLREDESPDPEFYPSPRFVTHIDDNAISLLREYYAHNLPSSGRILDFCSSWVSHFPPVLEKKAIQSTKGEEDEDSLQVIGMGINERELAKNPILKGRIMQDLNTNPQIPEQLRPLDAATCVVSIDYLIHPLEVLSSLRSLMKPGGQVHLIISNRCFPTKAVGRWLRVGQQEKLNMVGDYLWFAGWRNIEVLTICDGQGDGGGWFGLGSPDPLWVVRGKNVLGEVEAARDEHKEL